MVAANRVTIPLETHMAILVKTSAMATRPEAPAAIAAIGFRKFVFLIGFLRFQPSPLFSSLRGRGRIMRSIAEENNDRRRQTIDRGRQSCAQRCGAVDLRGKRFARIYVCA